MVLFPLELTVHFPVPPWSRFETSLLEWRAVEFINQTWTCKKWLDLHVTPNGVFSTVAEHNLFGRLGTCRKVVGGGESQETPVRVSRRPFLEAILSKQHVRNVFYSEFCTEKIKG